MPSSTSLVSDDTLAMSIRLGIWAGHLYRWTDVDVWFEQTQCTHDNVLCHAAFNLYTKADWRRSRNAMPGSIEPLLTLNAWPSCGEIPPEDLSELKCIWRRTAPVPSGLPEELIEVQVNAPGDLIEAPLSTFQLKGWKSGMNLSANPNADLEFSLQEIEPPIHRNDVFRNRLRAMAVAVRVIARTIEANS